MTLQQKQLRLMIALILMVALLSRFLVLVYIGKDSRNFYTYDSKGYVTRAINLMRHGVFSGDQQPPLTPDTIRTPAYPLFVAISFSLFGEEPSIVIIMQILLGSLTALLTFLLAKGLRLTTLAGLTAACIVAIDPVSILLTNHLLTETLFTFELVAGIWLLSLFWHKQRVRTLIASAIVIALAGLTRPIAGFLPIALLPLFALPLKRRTLRTIAINGLLFIFISGTIMSLWAYRNYHTNRVFTLSTISDTNLIYYRARAVLAEAENISQRAARKKLETEIEDTASRQGLSLCETIALQRRRAIQIFVQYPLLTTSMVAKGAVRLLFDPGFTITCTLLDLSSTDYECVAGEATMLESGILGKTIGRFLEMTTLQQFTLMWSVVLLGITYVGVSIGVIHLVRNRNWLTIALLLELVLYLVLLSAGGETNYRFRAPVLPFLAILAGVGYGTIRAKHSHRETSTKGGHLTPHAPDLPSAG